MSIARVASLEFRGASSKIKSFTDLRAWKLVHILSVSVYQATKEFPKSEVYGLTNQIRRSVVSVESNVAEGFGRRTPADRLHFYDMARASLAELQTQLLLARDVDYLDVSIFDELAVQAVECQKTLAGLIRTTSNTKLEARSSKLGKEL